MPTIRTRCILLILAAALTTPTSSPAASLEVLVRDSGGRPLKNERVQLQALAVEGGRRNAFLYRRGRLSGSTDLEGRVTFGELPPGTYLADVPWPRRSAFLRPADNPLAPPPQVSLFDDQEHLQTEIVLSRGLPVMVLIDLPENDFRGFHAHFRHRESGRSLATGFPRDKNFVERLLVPGIWEISVEPRPGYLLVGVDRDRQPLPGHTVSLDLAQEPASPYLTWTYAAPCRLDGVVVEETGRPPAVTIEAALLEPGPWHEAARRRGGSLFERVTAGVDPRNGRYEMVLPDGVWSVRPVSPLLAASQPEEIDLVLVPGDTSRADFTVRLDQAADREPFEVDVVDPQYQDLHQAPVEVHTLEDLAVTLSSGITDRSGTALLPGLSKGSYLVVAGHEDFLEGRLELPDYDPEVPTQRPVRIVLTPGASIRLEARDPADRPLADVALTVERLGDAPEVLLRAAAFVEAKSHRTAVTDRSGRAAVTGFYPGTHRARARLGGRQGTRGLIRIGLKGERLREEIDFEISGEETVDLEAGMLPAGSLGASLVCSDGWALPGAASARVVDARVLSDAQLEPPSDAPGERAGGKASGAADRDEPWHGQVLALEDALLTGRARDTLVVGPLEQGVYRLAVRPTGFDRWTWAFETHDHIEATEIQVAVAKEASGPIDLGVFQVECGPAVDVTPAVATGESFPDVHQIGVEVRVLDPEDDREISRSPAILRRGGRLLLRGLPRGEQRLEITLTHPHLLPQPALTWPLVMELERGQYREVVLEVEALGGAIQVAGEGGSAVLHGPEGEPRRATLTAGKAELPSLVPGRYRLELFDDSGKLARFWPELEVLAGETLRLEGVSSRREGG